MDEMTPTDAERINIPGAPHNPYVPIAARYDYVTDKTKCPACGGSGIPWAGWFSCDSDFTGNRCYCIAVVSDGRAFVPAPIDPLANAEPLAPMLSAVRSGKEKP